MKLHVKCNSKWGLDLINIHETDLCACARGEREREREAELQ